MSPLIGSDQGCSTTQDTVFEYCVGRLADHLFLLKDTFGDYSERCEVTPYTHTTLQETKQTSSLALGDS